MQTNKKIFLLVISSVFITALLANVTAVNAKTVEIKSKESYIFFCVVSYKVTFDTLKINIGDSKTVGCDTDKSADIHLNPYLPTKQHFSKVFWCDHDNPLILASSDSMDSGDVWTIKCVK